MPAPLGFYVIVIVACVFIGLSKGGFGGPVPVALLTPLMSLIMPASQAVGIVLIPLLIGDLIALRLYWGKWDPKQIRLLLPLSVLGVVMGGALLLILANNQQDALLRRILGAFTLLVVIYKVASSRISGLQYRSKPWHGRLAGWAAGFGSALANVGAPPYTAYMLLQGIQPVSFISTTSFFFAIVNFLKLPITLLSSNVLNPHLLLSILWALPIIPVGAYLGKQFVHRIDQAAFERMMLVLLFIMGLFMVVGIENIQRLLAVITPA